MRFTIRFASRGDPLGRAACRTRVVQFDDDFPIRISTTVNPFLQRINQFYGGAHDKADITAFGLDIDEALAKGCIVVIHRYNRDHQRSQKIEWLSQSQRVGIRWYPYVKTCWEMEVCLHAYLESQLPDAKPLIEESLGDAVSWTGGIALAESVTNTKLELGRVWDTLSAPDQDVTRWHPWLTTEDLVRRKRSVGALEATDDFMRRLAERLASAES